MKTNFSCMIGISVMLFGLNFAHARGFGGGFHGGGFGGGGFHGGGFEAGGFHAGGAEAGGFHAGGFEAGGFHASGAEAGGFHASGAEAGGFHAGGVEAGGFHAGGVEAGGFHAGGLDAGGFHAGGVEAGAFHTGLPTDGAFGRGWAGAGGYAVAGNHTAAWSGSVYAARGAAVRNSYVGYGAFRGDWYGGHPGAWFAAGWGAGAAWRVAAWPAVGAWCGWDAAAQPFDYDYGNNITYQGDEVYYADQPVATADQYYQQAQTLAQVAPPAAAPKSDNWMPLGVFSLVQGDQSDSATMFQLAINKSGAVAGNYYSELAGTTLPVHGSADKKTQRVAWTVGDNKTTVYEAGVSSLTKDEAPVLVHFGKDRTQQWMLVRLKPPTAEQSAGN